MTVYLHYMEQFRAVAITFVVAGHVMYYSGVERDSQIELMLGNLLVNGTVYFVFIAGFLFHHLSRRGFSYGPFLRKKVKTLLVPYLFLGLVPVVFHVAHQNSHYAGHFLPQGEGVWAAYVEPAFKYYLTGRFMLAYWFMPFIMLMFLLAPLHLLYARLSFKVQLSLVAILTFVALWVHRPFWGLNPVHSLVYFLPVYLLGIFFSVHADVVAGHLRKYELALVLLAVFLMILQADIGASHIYSKDFFELNGVDLQLAHTLMLCMALFSWLHRHKTVSPASVSLLASASFAVYFLHPFFLTWLGPVVAEQNWPDWLVWLLLPLFTALVMAVCVEIARCLRHYLGDKSRYLVGY